MGQAADAPQEIVEAAREHLGFDIYDVARSDPALRGAHALLDSEAGHILCERDLKPVERALVIAHELGHATLHAATCHCALDDVDASRSSEAAPVGLQRVEDYGARERRELQANVFARELVLPRSLARRMHVDEKLSATAIAQRTGLPLDVVRQQLFDALLLPARATVATRSTTVTEPDCSQVSAAGHRGAPFQLQAGPGTGKTRTLVMHISQLLQRGVEPTSILVLTFSNRAAGELLERISAAEPRAAGRIWVGTFHSFGLDLTRRYHNLMNRSPNPTLFDRSDAIAILQDVLPTLELKHFQNLWEPAVALRDILNGISRAKDEMVDAAGYRRLAHKMLETAGRPLADAGVEGASGDEDESEDEDDARAAAEKCGEIADVYERYEDILRTHDAFDFGDLIMRPALLLENDASVREAVAARHRHVLVDEYQDVNRASGRFLRAIAGDGKRLWVVGDARQSIYRFRGASSANMRLFKEDYDGVVAQQLDVSYRSTTTITETLNAAAPMMCASAGMLPLQLRANGARAGAKVQIVECGDPADEAATLARGIRELQRDGIGLRDQAVLCRSNARLGELAQALEAADIPVLHLGSFFERDDVRSMLSLLSLAVDRYANALPRIANLEPYAMPLQDVHDIIRFLDQGLPPIEGLRAAAAPASGLSDVARACLTRLVEDVAALATDALPWTALATYLLDRSDIVRRVAASSDVRMQMQGVALWQLLNFIRDNISGPAGSPIQRVLNRARELVFLAEERDLRQVPAAALHLDAVRLMTVHGAKGLEFEALHLPGVATATFPANYRRERFPTPIGLSNETATAKERHAEEEECLFFVALSRARAHVRVYQPTRQPNGNKRSPSRFAAWLPSAHCERRPLQQQGPSSPPTQPRITITPSEAWTVTDAQLALYAKCPRRYFYTHVLGLAGKRKLTPFAKTDECLHELIDWMAVERIAPSAAGTVKAKLDEIWTARGPTTHELSSRYRQLADRLVDRLLLLRHGTPRTEPAALRLAVGADQSVTVLPTEVVERAGRIVVRTILTRAMQKKDSSRLEVALTQLAASEAFGATADVERIYLADGERDCVPAATTAKAEKMRPKAADMLQRIRDGAFPPEVDSVSCPRCPHFFTCDAVPAGDLRFSGSATDAPSGSGRAGRSDL